MTITIHYTDGSSHTLPQKDAVPIVEDSSDKPKPGYRRLQREYPPEYVKTANILAGVLAAGVRVMTNGAYKVVDRITEGD